MLSPAAWPAASTSSYGQKASDRRVPGTSWFRYGASALADSASFHTWHSGNESRVAPALPKSGCSAACRTILDIGKLCAFHYQEPTHCFL